MWGRHYSLDRVKGIRLLVGSDLTQVSAHQGSSSSSKVTLPHSGSSLSVWWPSLRGILPLTPPHLVKELTQLGPWPMVPSWVPAQQAPQQLLVPVGH